MKSLAELVKIRDNIQELIDNYEDGFEYLVDVHSFGSHDKYYPNNIQTVMDITNEYQGDNGYCHIYSTDPDIKNKEHGPGVSNVIYISKDKWNVQKLVSKLKKQQMHYNA